MVLQWGINNIDPAKIYEKEEWCDSDLASNDKDETVSFICGKIHEKLV